MATSARVKTWGRNMALVIPRGFAKSRNIHVGTVVDLDAIKVLLPRRKRYKVAELMSQYRPQHRHGEWHLGAPVGAEVW